MRIIFIALILISCNGKSDNAPKMNDYFKGLKTKIVKDTIVLDSPGVYDFKKVVHIWRGVGKCIQKENQPSILRIEGDNITVKNFYFKGDSGDPIHISTCGKNQGEECTRRGPKNVTLDNIIGHACEDLITIGTPGASNITIKNSKLFGNPKESERDKILQVNFGKDLKLINNIFVNSPRCIRLKPSTSALIKGNKFYNCKNPIRASSNDYGQKPMMKNGPVKIVSDDCDKVTKIGNDVSCKGD